MTPTKTRKRKKTDKPKLGRPPAGHNGSLVSKYERLTLRMDPETHALVDAWVRIAKEPAYVLIARAIAKGIDRLNPPAKARQIRQSARVWHDTTKFAAEKGR